MNKSTTPPLPLIAKIAIAMTFINTWVIFEETIVDRHGLWRYMPYYRVGLFCVWDAAVFAITVLLLLVNVRPSRRRDGPTQSTTPPLPLIAKIATTSFAQATGMITTNDIERNGTLGLSN